MKKKNICILFAALLGIATPILFGVCAKPVSAPQQTHAAVTSNMFRFWISEDNGNKISQANAVIKLWVHNAYEEGGNVEIVEGKKWYNNAQERNYWYFDLHSFSLDKYVTVQRFSPTDGTWWNNISTRQLTTNQVKEHQVMYVWADWAGSSFGSIDSVDAGMAAKALEGLLTCDSSDIWGYNAFNKLKDNFIRNGDAWRTQGNLSDYNISDFNSVSDYNDASKRTKNVNAYDKYLALEKMANSGGVWNTISTTTLNTNDMTSIYVIVVSSTSLLISFALVLKRKKTR